MLSIVLVQQPVKVEKQLRKDCKQDIKTLKLFIENTVQNLEGTYLHAIIF